MNYDDQAPTTRGPRAQVAGQEVEADEAKIDRRLIMLARAIDGAKWRSFGFPLCAISRVARPTSPFIAGSE